MKVTPISKPLSGEQIVGVRPEMRYPTVQAGWQQRLNLYTGRSLSDTALTAEQVNRAGRLATRGQMRSTGVVSGLAIGLELLPQEVGGGTEEGPPPSVLDQSFFHITAGYAITPSGEDVVVPKNMRVAVGAVPVYTTAELLAELGEVEGTNPRQPDQPLPVPVDVSLGEEPTSPDTSEEGGLKARRLGPSLNTLVEAGLSLPRAGILVLQPIVIKKIGEYDAGDPCEQDPQNYAFEDWQLIDGCQLILYTWPVELTEQLPLPAFDDQWRNRLAYTIFEAEMMNGVGQLMPWERIGAPIGLVGFDEAMNPLFVDRHAVVRAGGKPKRRSALVPDFNAPEKLSALVPNAGHPFLWQARIQQFAEQLADAGLEENSVEEAAQKFRFLPPTGLLPREVLSINDLNQYRDRFFPDSYRVDAAPVPLEQLDAAIEASAALKFFDAATADEVRLLVPVPQIFYEPNLLKQEREDEEFQQNIATSVRKRGKWLKRRVDVHAIAEAINAEIKGADASFPDPEMLEGEVAAATQIDTEDPADEELSTPEEAYETTIVGEKPIANAYQALQTEFNQDGFFMKKELFERAPNVPDINRMDRKGLQGFIEFLEEKVKRANDIIDFGFVRVQTDIYRVRQLVLGNMDATRLATSPALAAIAKGNTALATKEEIINFVQAAKGRQLDFRATPGDSTSGSSSPLGGVPGTRDAVPQPATRETADTDAHAAGENLMRAGIGSNAMTSAAVSSAAFSLVNFGSTFGGTIGGATKIDPLDERAAIDAATLNITGFGDNRATGMTTVEANRAAKMTTAVTLFGGATATPRKEAVFEQSPIVGHALDFRTVTVAERIKEAPAPEAKNFSVANKYEIVKALAELSEIIVLDDLEIPGFYEYNADGTVKVNNVEVTGPGGVKTIRQIPRETRHSFSIIKRDKLDLQILQSRHDFDPADGDESAFFAAGVRASDHAVATLRIVEGRIQSYRGVIERCKKTLETLKGLASQVGSRLRVIESQVAEIRHDVAVAEALLAEERARVADINERRKKIIAEHVPFLAFHRPRTTELMQETKARTLDPGLMEAPVPACLARSVEPPPELRAMLDLLRAAPVKWFTGIPPLLDKFDRPEYLQLAIQNAKLRATQQFAAKQLTSRASAFGVGVGALGGAIEQVVAAQHLMVAQHRVQTAQLDLSLLAGQSWSLTRNQAREVVSLGDLIDASHGRSDVSKEAAREMENIAHVAACLYTAFGAVLPSIRLEWAERISQYDAPVSLRNLSSLPRWGEIKFLERREMQTLADWLFLRIDARQSAALGLVNDLVRICILLASHAPINKIIAGRVPRRTEVKEGGRVELTVDLTKVRVGMHVLMYNGGNSVVARGIVEDLGPGGGNGGGQVEARVIEVHAAQKTLSLIENARVQIAEPDAFERSSLTSGRALTGKK